MFACFGQDKSAIPLDSSSNSNPEGLDFPERSWERHKNIQENGWSPGKLKLAKEFSNSIDTDSLIIVENGQIVDEWGNISARYNVNSIRKCILSVLYGIGVDEGKIDLNQTLEQLSIDDNEPSLTKEEKQARILDLIQAKSGIYHPAAYESDSVKANRPKRGSHQPGTFLYYNNWDFNALGTIYNQAMKASLFEIFRQRIAEPLKMEDFRKVDTEYFQEKESIHPAYLFRLSARDLARFGWLVFNLGKWQQKQIVSKDWIIESTKPHSDAGNSGYGYMWWVAVNGKLIPNVQLNKGSISCSGYGGQWLVVIPERKLVVVHLVDTENAERNVTGEQFGKLLSLILESKTDLNGTKVR